MEKLNALKERIARNAGELVQTWLAIVLEQGLSKKAKFVIAFLCILQFWMIGLAVNNIKEFKDFIDLIPFGHIVFGGSH